MVKEYIIKGPITQEVIASLIGNMGNDTSSGGHSIFLGQVRADEIDNKKVRAIEYSAYEKMVKVEADKIKKAIFSEYDDVKSIRFVHSTGEIKAGELSLLVFVSAGHRRQAIYACQKTVELIKEKLPVWKKEIFEDDSHKWK